MPWLLNEADALKQKLAGLTVSDQGGTNRPVEVWFRNPENELRDMTYPSIVLEYSGLEKAGDREHRGPTYLPYIPEEFQPGPVAGIRKDGSPISFDTRVDFMPEESPFLVQDHPIPHNLDFKVTVYSRFQSELMPIINSLSKIDRIPIRFGFLEVAQDDTVRTLDLLGGPEIVASRDGEGRRLFMAVYVVRVATELNLYTVEQITSWITEVDVHLTDRP